MQVGKEKKRRRKKGNAPNIAMFHHDSDLGELVPSDNKMLLRACVPSQQPLLSRVDAGINDCITAGQEKALKSCLPCPLPPALSRPKIP